MNEDPEKTEETTGKETGNVSRVTPNADELLDLAKRHRLALALDDADPGFRLTEKDMRMIEWALSFAASAVGMNCEHPAEPPHHGPDWNVVLGDCGGANPDDNATVTITRGTARHAASALRRINEADYYHNNGAAERELRAAMSKSL